jgi:pimeloyl-ACP methyl ester carboxylesterase
MRAPILMSPLFCIASLRMIPEIVAAKGAVRGAAFTIQHVATVLLNFFSPRLMARRAQLVASLEVEPELARVRCPTLVVTGEPALDRVVPVALTRDYHRIWPHAARAVLERTGHLGPITRPDEFARLVVSFAARSAEGTEPAKATDPHGGAEQRSSKPSPFPRFSV